jgi:hypothetical protein
MTSLPFQLPDDIQGCHALIEQLRVELHAAPQRIATLQSEADESRNDAAHIGRLENLVAQYQETIADQEQTIQDLAADNALLKRSLFGSRRERFVHDPSQQLLFGPAALDSPEPEKENKQPPEPKKKRTSKGRQARVFPEFLPREEQKIYLDPADIPEVMRDSPNARRFFKKVGETLEMVPMQLKVVEQFQEVIALDLPDETTMMELGGPGRTLKGYLWAAVGDARHPYDCFFYTSDRRSIRAETLLTDFQGYLTADAYVAYE